MRSLLTTVLATLRCFLSDWYQHARYELWPTLARSNKNTLLLYGVLDGLVLLLALWLLLWLLSLLF